MIYLVVAAAAVILLAIIITAGIYNSLIQLRNSAQNAWAQIDTQLKRRHDLIPNLIETVKGYAQHEKSTFELVVQARNLAISAGSDVSKLSNAENALSGALKNLFALSESYPELKANENFLSMQEELSTTENRISFARQAYNDAVMMYVNKIQQFPSNIIAAMFGFKTMDYFEVQDSEKENVKVQF